MNQLKEGVTMKSILSIAALICMSMTAFGNPLICREDGNKYALNLNNDHQIAQVLYDGKTVEFGELQCRDITTNSNRNSDLYCASTNVADDGYTAHFVQLDGASHVHLSKISFVGVKYLTTLPCSASR